MINLQNSFLRGWRLYLFLYLILLLCSLAFEVFLTNSNSDHLIQKSDYSDSTIVLVFPDLEQKNEEFNDLISELKETYQVYTVDYKQASVLKSDLSARNYAAKIRESLNNSEIDKIHILGKGFGVIFASQFIAVDDENIKSMALIDPEGILEYELLGGHLLNSSAYRLAGIIYWSMNNLIPDFGLFSKTRFNEVYPKIRLDTDLRSARSLYKSLEIPTLIVTNSDNETNIKQSKEFERLILTSRQSLIDNDSQIYSDLVKGFIENPKDKIPQASALKKIKSQLPFSFSNITDAKGWVLAGLIILIIFSTFISEDLACIGAGLMVARGLMGFLPAVAACFAGIFVGDILIYLSGRWLGKNAISKVPFKWFINEKDISRSNIWFKQKGPVIILISRFIPGTRFPTYFTAGVIGASFWMFVFYFGIASLLWTPAIVSLAMVLGNNLIFYFSVYQDYALLVLVSLLLFIYLILKIVIPLFTFRGRRLLYGKFKRLINWEFWPPYFLYAPVVLYSLFLGIKHGKITVVTAANPGIEEGGFKGESKERILDQLNSKELVANYCLLNSSEDSKELLASSKKFMEVNSIDFPIVLKPEKGERGKGVYIIKNKTEFKERIENLDEEYLLQEFIKGEEFGIFYYRFPNKIKGKIFSITKKLKPTLQGDGKQTIEELILNDNRAVIMAETHFNTHSESLYTIPENYEIIELVELGTHSRGAIFLDGSDFLTQKLSDKMDEIAQKFEGFYFGRFDIIAPSKEDLKQGHNIKVIELNGVTSESTHIYDPKYSYFDAVRILIKQWKIAFEIGSMNYKRGVEIPSLKHMISVIFDN
jgi:membrane protein DedA with SNARE-associated domain